jgi:predicted nuclease of predicted toxin-antitoxin system
MKILLDQGVPRSAAALLRAAGIDAVHTAEVGLATATDERILEFAETEGYVVVTLDADFHALLALAGARSPSVIRIRQARLGAAAVVTIVQSVVQQASAELEQGALVTVQAGRVRVRRLPIIR